MPQAFYTEMDEGDPVVLQDVADLNAAHLLMTAFNILAPDAKAQGKMAKDVASMDRNGLHRRDICEHIAGRIHDGLRHGNW